MNAIRTGRGVIVAAALAITVTGCSKAELEANFVPESDPWTRWTAHDPDSTQSIDHGDWDRFLARYLSSHADGLNRVAYRRVTATDRAALDSYIDRLEAIPISTHNKAEQFAFWVNLYNAVTVRTVLDAYPVDSIREINDGLLSPGPWDRELATVEGQSVTLNDIESRILRPLWQDPRAHYVLNCASVGCPNLDQTALRGTDLEPRLEAAARRYINNPRGVRIADDDLVVSSIYIWFQGDFGGSDSAVLTHINAYADPDLKRALSNRAEIDGYEYDWSLNESR